MSAAYARRAVARGAALLDREMPGWAERIDLEMLDLASGTECVLGQLFPEQQTVEVPRWLGKGRGSVAAYVRSYGGTRRRAVAPIAVCDANYNLGRYTLGLGYERCRTHGFDHSINATYAELDEAWARAVEKRQAAA